MAFVAVDVAVEMVRALRPALELIGKRDADLADQLRRAAASVALNLAEGRRRAGRDRPHSFRVALGSADEVIACLRVAEGFGYLELAAIERPWQLADRVVRMVWGLAR